MQHVSRFLATVLVASLILGAGATGATGATEDVDRPDAEHVRQVDVNETINETQNATANATNATRDAVEDAVNETTNATANSTRDSNETLSSNETIRIGPVSKVTSWTYRDGVMRLTIKSKIPHIISIAENVEDADKGVTYYSTARTTLPRGTKTVSIPAEQVSLSTPGCMSQGRCPLISVTDDTDPSNPFTGYSPAPAWAGGLAVGAGFFALGIRSVMSRDWRDYERLEDRL